MFKANREGLIVKVKDYFWLEIVSVEMIVALVSNSLNVSTTI